MIKKSIEKYIQYSHKLPILERVGLNIGNICMVYGGVLTELGNPLQGGAVFVTAAGLCIISTGTKEAREALD